jgi:hypothetical protein
VDKVLNEKKAKIQKCVECEIKISILKQSPLLTEGFTVERKVIYGV